MSNTLTKYTVSLWCENKDAIVQVHVAVEPEFDDVFEIAEAQHNARCRVGGFRELVCSSEGSTFEEGWAMPRCNCYVLNVPEHISFALRSGAHDYNCPVYRTSRDPVDQIKDKDNRAYWKSQMHKLKGVN